jgi:hypothetical protein
VTTPVFPEVAALGKRWQDLHVMPRGPLYVPFPDLTDLTDLDEETRRLLRRSDEALQLSRVVILRADNASRQGWSARKKGRRLPAFITGGR